MRSSEPGWTMLSLDDRVAAKKTFSMGREAPRRSNHIGLLQMVRIIHTFSITENHEPIGVCGRGTGHPKGQKGLVHPQCETEVCPQPPPQGRRRRSRDILAMADPKCWSAFRRKVLQVEATFMSISGGEGGEGNGSALGGGRKGSHGSWGQLRRQQGGTSADLLGEDRRFG